MQRSPGKVATPWKVDLFVWLCLAGGIALLRLYPSLDARARSLRYLYSCTFSGFFRYSGTCNHAHRRCCRVKVPLCCRLFLMPNFPVINNHLFFLQETLLLFLDSTRKYIRNLDFGIARLYTSKKLCIKGGYPIHSLISIGHLITFY